MGKVGIYELKPCPFCGGDPTVTEFERVDDSRYVQKTLECCVFSISAGIPYGTYKNMTDPMINNHLNAALEQKWNTRYEPDEEE